MIEEGVIRLKELCIDMGLKTHVVGISLRYSRLPGPCGGRDVDEEWG